ncbi:MAG: energy transducer TonB [Myxococcota bacterium]
MSTLPRAALVVASLTAHVVFGMALGGIPREKKREATAISVAEPKKKEPKKPEKVEPPKPVEAKAPPAPRAPAPAPPPPAPAEAPAAAAAPKTAGYRNLGAIPAAAGSGGGAAPAGPARAMAPEKPVAPKLKSLAPAPPLASDGCAEEATKPKRTKAVTPVYPAGARESQIEGTVRFEADIDEEGRVVAVRVLEGLGHGLDEATIEAVKGWTFEPALRCGKPVRATIKTKVSFSLS